MALLIPIAFFTPVLQPQCTFLLLCCRFSFFNWFENKRYRWPYADNRQTIDARSVQAVVKSLPCCHHTARSLRFHPEQPGLLLVHVGSASNVDRDRKSVV